MHDRTPEGGERRSGPADDKADAAEEKQGRTKFSQDGALPEVEAKSGKGPGSSASDLAFGDDSLADFRAAVRKKDPSAISIAGKSPAAIGALLAKEPAVAAEYFTIVEANRSDAHRDSLKALFTHLTLADKKKLFAAQFGFAIVEQQRSEVQRNNAAEFQPDQIDKMYEAALMLPPAHMIGNPRFKKLEAGQGATFHDRKDTIEMPSYKEASTGTMEEKYSSAFRHEVGHAVDFALGDKTNKLRGEFGWHVINERDDDENLAAHFEGLGVLKPGLEAKERLDLAAALGGAISGGDDYMKMHLTFFKGYDQEKAADLITRGVTALWKDRKAAMYEEGLTIGDQHYFARGFGNGGWAYRVKKSTFDAAPEKGKVSHYEWFAEWYATYYAKPDHAGVPGRLTEFFRDEVDPFNQQRSPTGTPHTTEGTGGETPRHQ